MLIELFSVLPYQFRGPFTSVPYVVVSGCRSAATGLKGLEKRVPQSAFGALIMQVVSVSPLTPRYRVLNYCPLALARPSGSAYGTSTEVATSGSFSCRFHAVTPNHSALCHLHDLNVYPILGLHFECSASANSAKMTSARFVAKPDGLPFWPKSA